MSEQNFIRRIAESNGLAEVLVCKIAGELLESLHRGMVEYRSPNGDYFAERVYHELPERAFYHFLGFLEQFSREYDWTEGTINEYLGRMPPTDRWQELCLVSVGAQRVPLMSA